MVQTFTDVIGGGVQVGVLSPAYSFCSHDILPDTRCFNSPPLFLCSFTMVVTRHAQLCQYNSANSAPFLPRAQSQCLEVTHLLATVLNVVDKDIPLIKRSVQYPRVASPGLTDRPWLHALKPFLRRERRLGQFPWICLLQLLGELLTNGF